MKFYKIFFFFNEKLSPLHVAAKYNNFEIVNLLLENTEIEKGPNCFRGCSMLSQVTIPSSMKIIDEYFFYGCSSLKMIRIPSSITSIGFSAFFGCSSLQRIEFDSPPSLTSIKSFAFKSCFSLKEIKIPSSVTSISDGLFFSCTALSNVDLPSSISKIGPFSFNGCHSLKEITIPDSISEIEANVFSNCSSLQNVIIPSSVRIIGDSSFSKCSSLVQIVIPPNVARIGMCAFEKCTSLSEIKIRSSKITSFDKSTFESCSSLKSIIIPSSIITIGESVFKECTSLCEIVIPSSVHHFLGRISNRSALTDFIFCAALSSLKQYSQTDIDSASKIIKFVSSFLKFGDGFRRLISISLTEKIDFKDLFQGIVEYKAEFNEIFQQLCGCLINDQLFFRNFSKISYEVIVDKIIADLPNTMILQSKDISYNVWNDFWFHIFTKNCFQYNIENNKSFEWVDFSIKVISCYKKCFDFVGSATFLS